MASYYMCTQDNNVCDKKENCIRYLQANNTDEVHTTLFKQACTESNNWILYIEQPKEEEKNG